MTLASCVVYAACHFLLIVFPILEITILLYDIHPAVCHTLHCMTFLRLLRQDKNRFRLFCIQAIF